MHPALRLEEIVAAVCDQFDPNTTQGRSTLASLSYTCRTFSEPALDVLWAKPLLWQLAQRMSSDLWTIIDVSSEHNVGYRIDYKLILRDSLSTDAAQSFGARFVFYAKRTKVLDLNIYEIMGPNGMINVSVGLGVLDAWAATKDLFPRVHRLCISYPIHGQRLADRVLMSTSLTALELYFESHNLTPSFDLRQRINEFGPRLDELVVYGNWLEGHELSLMVDLTKTILSHTSHLRVLKARGALPLLYKDLMRLAPNLRVLELDGVINLPDRRFAFPFKYLRTLDIKDDTPSLELTPRFLAFPPNKSFKEFSLSVGFDTAFEPRNVEDILLSLGQHTTLQAVFLILGSYESNLTQTLDESSRFLHALCPLSDLRRLILSFYTQFPLDLSIISDLLCACPRLQTWEMWHGEEGNRRVACTIPLESFLRLIEGYPGLRELPVSINLPVAEEMDKTFGTHHYGPMLFVDPDSVEDTTEGRAVFLKELSPFLPRVHYLRFE